MDSNRQLAYDVFEQTARGHLRALTDAMADDCRWTFAADRWWAGTWEPKAAMIDRLLTPLMAQIERGYRIEADLVLADGDRVVVQARGRGTTRRGDAYTQAYCFILRVADGRITELVEHCDTALVEAVLEPRWAGGHGRRPGSSTASARAAS